MDASKAVVLLQKYNECPECGSDRTGDNKNVVKIHKDTFFRSCECGWSVKVVEGDADVSDQDKASFR